MQPLSSNDNFADESRSQNLCLPAENSWNLQTEDNHQAVTKNVRNTDVNGRDADEMMMISATEDIGIMQEHHYNNVQEEADNKTLMKQTRINKRMVNKI